MFIMLAQCVEPMLQPVGIKVKVKSTLKSQTSFIFNCHVGNIMLL